MVDFNCKDCSGTGMIFGQDICHCQKPMKEIISGARITTHPTMSLEEAKIVRDYIHKESDRPPGCDAAYEYAMNLFAKEARKIIKRFQ